MQLWSFGGGDAYLTIADGLFVDGGFISSDLFYGNIVPIVNVLPGSILAKTLSSIGFFSVYSQGANVVSSLFMFLCGYSVCIGSSCLVFSIALAIYKKFSNLNIFGLVSEFLKLLISALLLNIIFTFIAQTWQINPSYIFIFVFIYVLNYFCDKKLKSPYIILVLISVVLAFLLTNTFAIVEI